MPKLKNHGYVDGRGVQQLVHSTDHDSLRLQQLQRAAMHMGVALPEPETMSISGAEVRRCEVDLKRPFKFEVRRAKKILRSR